MPLWLLAVKGGLAVSHQVMLRRSKVLSRVPLGLRRTVVARRECGAMGTLPTAVRTLTARMRAAGHGRMERPAG